MRGVLLSQSIPPAQRRGRHLLRKGRENPRMDGAPCRAGIDGERGVSNLLPPVANARASCRPASVLALGYAGDPELRHRCSTGGVLTALGQYLLASGRVDFVLQVKARPDRPLRTEQTLSFDAEAVLEAAGSRYGPAGPACWGPDARSGGAYEWPP